MKRATLKKSMQGGRQRGFGLVEVLVTLVIMAVGLLGIAALQIMSKRSNFEATQRTTASMLANFIVERMRANPDGLMVYAGALETPAASVGGPTPTYDPEPNPTCSSTTATCTANELATHDLWLWEQLIMGASEQIGTTNTGGLVSPTACITTNVPAVTTDRSGQYTVTIVWRGATKLSDPSTTNTCGSASGKYDEVPGKNEYRRMLAIDTYVTTSN